MEGVGGRGKREERCCNRELFGCAKIFFLERTCGDLESVSWARSHVEPRAAVCELGAEEGRGRSCGA